jgi:hypothetical protein
MSILVFRVFVSPKKEEVSDGPPGAGLPIILLIAFGTASMIELASFGESKVLMYVSYDQ